MYDALQAGIARSCKRAAKSARKLRCNSCKRAATFATELQQSKFCRQVLLVQTCIFTQGKSWQYSVVGYTHARTHTHTLPLSLSVPLSFTLSLAHTVTHTQRTSRCYRLLHMSLSHSRMLAHDQSLAHVCSRMLACAIGVCMHPRLAACIEKVYTLALNVRICASHNL